MWWWCLWRAIFVFLPPSSPSISDILLPNKLNDRVLCWKNILHKAYHYYYTYKRKKEKLMKTAYIYEWFVQIKTNQTYRRLWQKISTPRVPPFWFSVSKSALPLSFLIVRFKKLKSIAFGCQVLCTGYHLSNRNHVQTPLHLSLQSISSSSQQLAALM